MSFSLDVGADHQLEYHSYADYPEMWGDSYFAFQQQVDHAIAVQAPLVLAGDLLERSSPDSFTMKFLLEQLDRMQENRLEVYFNQGNHEFVRRQSWCGIHNWPKHLHKQCLPIRLAGGRVIEVYGIDYQPATKLVDEMRMIPTSASVLVVHQAWRELMGDHLPSDGSLSAMVPDNIELVITGDFHSHRLLRLINKTNHSFVALSPGSSTLQSLAEDPVKYFFTIGDNLDEVISVPLKNRPVNYAELISNSQAEMEIERLSKLTFAQLNDESLPSHLRMPIWHIRVNASLGPIVDHLEEAATGQAHLFIRPYSRVETIDKVVDHGVASFEEALHKELEQRPDLYAMAIRLWRASDVNKEAKQIVDDLLKEEVAT